MGAQTGGVKKSEMSWAKQVLIIGVCFFAMSGLAPFVLFIPKPYSTYCYDIAIIVGIVNWSMNPAIYLAFNTVFRAQAKNILSVCLPCVKKLSITHASNITETGTVTGTGTRIMTSNA